MICPRFMLVSESFICSSLHWRENEHHVVSQSAVLLLPPCLVQGGDRHPDETWEPALAIYPYQAWEVLPAWLRGHDLGLSSDSSSALSARWPCGTATHLGLWCLVMREVGKEKEEKRKIIFKILFPLLRKWCLLKRKSCSCISLFTKGNHEAENVELQEI